MFGNQNFAGKTCFDCFHTSPSLWNVIIVLCFTSFQAAAVTIATPAYCPLSLTMSFSKSSQKNTFLSYTVRHTLNFQCSTCTLLSMQRWTYSLLSYSVGHTLHSPHSVGHTLYFPHSVGHTLDTFVQCWTYSLLSAQCSTHNLHIRTVFHIHITFHTVFEIPFTFHTVFHIHLTLHGSLQSARQRGVRGTVRGVRGMRGTQKIKKN